MPGRLEAFRNLEKPTFRWHLRSWEDINAASWFTKSNYVNVVLIVAFVAIAIIQIKQQAVCPIHVPAPHFGRPVIDGVYH